MASIVDATSVPHLYFIGDFNRNVTKTAMIPFVDTTGSGASSINLQVFDWPPSKLAFASERETHQG